MFAMGLGLRVYFDLDRKSIKKNILPDKLYHLDNITLAIDTLVEKRTMVTCELVNTTIFLSQV